MNVDTGLIRHLAWAPYPDTGDSPVTAPWRRPAAIAAGTAGIALYNWWIVVALSGRLMTSTNELFSDLEAQGRPHALFFQHLDLAAGICFLAALLLRGPSADGECRGEYPWMLAFALAGVVGGRFAYACPE